MATDLKVKRKDQLEGALISTQVSEQVTITQRSILDGDQAWKMYTKTESDNRDRNETDAIIWNKYGGGQPFDQAALNSSGQGNRYNFPTGFMSSIIDRVTPVPIQIIDSARYLTSATLCNYDYTTKALDPSKPRKTDVMRERITKYIRRWPDWKTFCTGLCQELVLIGRAFSMFLDPYTPWPTFFRTDQAFLPNGTGEHARNIQVIVAKQDLLVHELVNFIKNKDAARDAGWDIQNCVKAINEALPNQPHTDNSTSTAQRSYEDALREGNLGASYSGAQVIPIAHVMAVEAVSSGKKNPVTHYILYRKGNHEVLFKKEDRFDRIEDVATLFTIEPGNGKFYGSKGLGRKLINKHLAIERARNRLFDQLEMSGLPILMANAANAPMAQFKVRHPFILLTTDAELKEQIIETNAKAYLDADAKMMDLAQQAVGQYLPNNLTNNVGEREKTAREVSVDYQREAEAKVAFLSRFWGQFADLISTMQRKLLDPSTNDEAAKELQAELLEAGITREEMEEFAKAPAAEVVQDLTQIQNQQIMAVAAKYGQHPQINQRELLIRDISAMASPGIAESIVLPEQGANTLQIEQARMQMLETEAILSDTNPEGIPSSPRDDHGVHLQILLPDLEQAVSKAVQTGVGPSELGKISNGLTHAMSHVQYWQQNGCDPKILKPFQKKIQEIDQALKKAAVMTAQAMTQQQDQMAQDQQEQMQQAQPPPVPPEKILDIYKDAPEKIRRQIEASLGFQPPNEAEMAQEDTREATLKHPDLPEKMAQAATPSPTPSAPPSALNPPPTEPPQL